MTSPTMTNTIKSRFFKIAYEIMDKMPTEVRRGKPGNKKEFARSIGWSYESMLMTEADPKKSIPLKAIIGICKVYGIDANLLLLGSTSTSTKTPQKTPVIK
jgi:hypothetical protein